LYCTAADDDDDDDDDVDDAGERCFSDDGVNSNTLCTLAFFDVLSHSTSVAVWKSNVRSKNPKLCKFKKLSLKKWSTCKFDE